MFSRFAVVVCLLSQCFLARAQSAAPPIAASDTSAPVEVVLPSALPSGDAVNDRLLFTFFPAIAPQAQPAPAVILLHFLGATSNADFQGFARDLAKRGIASAVVTLPYHMGRLRKGEAAGAPFRSSNLDVVARAFQQSAADVHSVTDWLSARPDVDARRLGIAGISLGAIITHLAMGQDTRLTVGVALLGGGNLPDIYTGSLSERIFGRRRAIAPEIIAKLRPVDPLMYANFNRPRRVLMIQAARDLVIPPRDAEELWEALGRPPIQWVDTNHPGLLLARGAVMRTAAKFFEGVWSAKPFDARDLPHIYVPTLKAGFIFNLDSVVTPAVELQFFSLGTRRDHLSLLHADVGMSGRGPFLGVAATVNAFVDVGAARRLGGRKVRPYASLHFAF